MNKPIKLIKTIEFSNVGLMLSIGVHPHERRERQKLLVSVSIRVRDSEEHDDIANTLDYDQVFHFLKSLEKSDHFDLQETICRQIIDFVLALPGVEQVKVSTKKPDIFEDTEFVGLSIRAEKSQ